MVEAVGYAVTFVFLAAGAALHAYADARPVAAGEAVRVALVALVGANAVGATFFAVRALPWAPLAGTLGAFVAAAAPALLRVGVIAALRREDARRSAFEGGGEPEPAGPPPADVSSGDVSRDGVVRLPADALVVLIGPAGCGKSTFAARHFALSQVVSSDECRERVSDDARKHSSDSFKLMYQLVGMRLKRGRLTVADATNVTSDKRGELLAIARQYRRPAVAIVFDLPEETCRERNEGRPRRFRVPVPAIRGQMRHLRESMPRLAEEGFTAVHVFSAVSEADGARLELLGEQPPPR